MKNNSLKRWLVLSVLLAFMCFSPHILLRAQSIANYAFSTSTSGTLEDLSSGSTSLLTGNNDDVATTVNPIGFNFVYMGVSYSYFSTNSNGQLLFHTSSGATAISGSNTTPSSGTPLLLPMGGDNEVNGGIRYKVIGSAPNRKFVLEWNQFYVSYTNLTNAGNMQLWLNEANSEIDFVYGAIYNSSSSSVTRSIGITTGTTATTQGSVTVGASPTYAGSATLVTNTFAAGSGTSTGSPLIANIGTSVEGTRRVYSFIPPVTNAASGLNFTAVTATGMTLNWTDNATNEIGYNIYRSTDGVTYTFAAQTAANATTYSATLLSPGTLYYWKVIPYAEGGEGIAVSGSQSTATPALSGVKTVGAGGDYQNLTTAFADINAQGLTGNVELQLITGYPAAPETYPILSCNNSATGVYSVKVYPTVPGLSITSANATGTLTLNGATNVTFDGRVNQTGAKDLVISNTNAGTSYAVQFVNDAKSNTLQYLTIQSANTSTSSGTIVFAGSTGTTGNDNNLVDNCDIKDGASTPLNAVYSAGTSTSVDNSGNIVSNSNIYNYYSAGSASNGIYLASNSSAWTINANKFYQTATRTSSAGSTHRAVNIITSNGNGYVITNNTIGYASSTGTGVMTYAGAFANRFIGIELTASNTGTASSIQGNTVTAISISTTSGTSTAPGIFSGISVLGGTVSIGNTSPNTIGSASGAGAIAIVSSTTGGLAFGIHANSTGTLNIVNNVVAGITVTGNAAAVSCGFVGINTSGASTLTAITGNTIGGSTANSIVSGVSGTTTTSSTLTGITAAGSSTTLTMTGNTVTNLTNYSNNTSSSLTGVANTGSATAATLSTNTVSNVSLVAGTLSGISGGAPTTLTANGNNVLNASVSGASGTIYGLLAGTTQFTFNGNVIHDLAFTANSGSSSSSVYGIYNPGAPTVENITNNQIYNLSIAGANTASGNIIAGIHTSTTSSTKNFSGNIINGLTFTNSSTGTAVINGISSALGTTVSIFKNKIYNLSASGTSSTVNGVLVSSTSGTATVNIYNNIIGDLKTPTASAADPIRGISLSSTTTTSTYRVYYNSVYLNASSTGTNFGTSGVYHAANATATTVALDLRNNIVINESTPSGTGITVAFRRSSASLGNFASTSNRNMFYAGTASATRLLMYDGTNSYQTISAYQTAVAPREVNSFTGEAAFTGTGYGTAGNFFISTTASNADYLKPVAGVITQVESGAVNISTPAITDDYAGTIRQGNAGYTGTGTAPDLGAFEFEGVSPVPVITLNSVTPPATLQCTATARVISVNVSPSTGTTVSVNLGYTVNGIAQTPIAMTNTTGTTWTATIPVPTPSNATIAWGITATNSVGVSGTYTGTSYADEPLFGVTTSATASVTTVCSASPTVLTAKVVKPGDVTSGTGATTIGTASTSEALSPLNQYYEGSHTQYLVLASDLTAAGLNAGPITKLGYVVTTKNSNLPFTSYNIKLASTTLTNLTSGNNTGTFTLVYASSSTVGSGYSSVLGLNTFVFGTGTGTSSSFTWDGTSNILVDICFANDPAASGIYYSNTDIVAANTKTYTATYGYYADNSSLCGTTNTNTSNSTKVPNFIFTGLANTPLTSVSWSDGVATVGTTNPLTVNPTANTTYTATITASGCTVSPSPSVNVTVNPLPATPTAVNSAQCGVQIPTAHVTSTSGLPTPTFNWYAASTGGTALQSNTSTTYTTTVSSTTTFYVSELNTTTGCESVRVPVTVTVSTPDQVSLTASASSICIGESVTLTAANTGAGLQSYTYSTQSVTTGSGAETALTGASVTVTPTAVGSYTYTLTAVDGGCTATATATVTVNGLPLISTATATPSTVCSSDPITLFGASANTTASTTTIGTQSSTDLTSSVYRFGYLTGDYRHQLVFTAAELNAAGLQAGNITSIAFNVTTVGSGSGNSFTIKMGNTNASATTATFLTDPTSTVYTAATYTAVSGVNTHTFSTPFNWNGTSNILIEICYNISTVGGSSYVAVSTPATNRNASLLAATNACTAASGTSYAYRPLVTFAGQVGSSYTSTLNWSWTPGTGLNTAVATTSIANSTGSPMSQAFTVTATNPTTGCVSTATTAPVTINPAPIAPVANNATQCGAGNTTVSVTGSGTPGNTYSWYLAATGGTALTGQTGSSLSGYSISATTTFYVSENNATCSSPRTAVTATVTTPPAVSIAGTAVVCNGSSTALTASSSNDPNYTYTWSGGLGTGATVNAAPTANTTYTVSAIDASGGANNGCVTNATISITVNPLPQSAPIVPATATICAGTVQTLTSGPTSVSGTAILGTGTTAPGTTSFPNPFSAWYGGTKHQMLFTTAELTAQGMVAGSQVTSVALDVNAYVANACTNFTIRMGSTSNTALTGFVTGTSTVYGPTTYTPSATGIVTFTLTTPFTWDGTSNVIVETVHNAGNSGNGSGTRTNTTTTTANTVYYGASDNVSGGIAGFDALSSWTNSGASNLRPNIRFAFASALTPTWSPAGTLYTDAGATTAYTGTGVSSVYAKPTTTTTYVATYTGSNGCTVQKTATITVNQPSTSTSSATACDSYTWNGTAYTASGTYTHTLTNSVGCDSVATLNLTIKHSTASSASATACSSYTWALTGQTYTTSGAYTHTIPNAVGCDSVITLNLTINQPTASTVTATGCGSYTWALTGQTYTTSGAYTHTIPNAAGCDSVVTLNLTIGQPNTGTDTQTACGSFTWIDGVTYTASTNTPTFTVPNASGCDSVVTLHLTINMPSSGTATPVVACGSYTWPLSGSTYTTSGTYTHTLTNSVGCDSVISLNVTINQPSSSSVSATSCGSYTWSLSGQTYNASGAYTHTIPNAAGCDSVITLNLTINPKPVVTLTNNGNGSFTASSTVSGTYAWLNCTTNTVISGATSATYTPSVNGSYAAIVTTANGCSDTSACMTINNVGIKENAISTISVHPNPTHDVVIVTMEAQSATVEVFDAQGKLVQTSQIKSGDQIDLGAYERGVYTLKIRTEVGTSVERIVKN